MQVLYEHGKPNKELQQKRAAALRIVGDVFTEVGSRMLEERLRREKAENPMDGAQRRLEDARNAMVEHMDKLDHRD